MTTAPRWLTPLLYTLTPLLAATSLACADDGSSEGATTETGDPSTMGDGDGDPSTTGDGDGDGDPTTGDGDGDGDGDPTTTGDGDGDGDGDPTTTGDGDGDPQFCTPGEAVCQDDGVATCLDDGSAFGPVVSCSPTQDCLAGTCYEKCDLAQSSPSSVGCSFLAHRMDNYDPDEPDTLVVGNVSEDDSATVQLYQTPVASNVEQPVGNAVIVPPGGVQLFEMNAVPFDGESYKRQGGTYRVESDIPVVAYLHSPLEAIFTNDASMLLPEYALRNNHIVASYYPWLSNYYPSYFNVIAAEDMTIVSWTPPVATLAGVGVPAVNAGGTGQVIMNRGDALQVVSANHIDVSGTYVSSDKPIAVISGSEIVNVPAGVKYADHIEEQMLPLDYWGEEYVGPRAPPRGTEKFHWRIYGGEDGVTVSASPNAPGFPIQLDQGEWFEFAATTSHVFTGTGPFLPVQYLEGKSDVGGAGTGDPSMYQMIPTEQFLSAYTFATGTGYSITYVQVIREQGGADVLVDGEVVTGYFNVGNYEVADWTIDEGNHFATSDGPFGIINLAYTAATSYAYPGGMGLSEINPQ